MGRRGKNKQVNKEELGIQSYRKRVAMECITQLSREWEQNIIILKLYKLNSVTGISKCSAIKGIYTPFTKARGTLGREADRI